MTDMELDIVELYLCNTTWSHRRIQAEIMAIRADVRGGGYEAMHILHHYGIQGEHKGILRNRVFDRERFRTSGNLIAYLRDS